MFLLFLDTETTGVDFAKDQVIEIGALIYDLDPLSLKLKLVSKFQSTVALRKEMDERITRITGITTQELSTARSVVKVQQDWNIWLEKYEKELIAIVGHSIDFDITFLKKEGWFLPVSTKIDTLDLAKILMPDMQAVNLEFLSKKLNLEARFDTLDTSLSSSNQGFSHHRSLYDSVMCAGLFENLLQKLSTLNLTQEFYTQLQKHFLPLPLIWYGKEIKKIDLGELVILSIAKDPFIDSPSVNLNSTRSENEADSATQNQQIIGLNGEPKALSLADKIELLDQRTANKINQLLNFTWTQDLCLVLLQLSFISGLKTNTQPQLITSKFLKLHGQGYNLFGSVVIDYILASWRGTRQSKNLEFQSNPSGLELNSPLEKADASRTSSGRSHGSKGWQPQADGVFPKSLQNLETIIEKLGQILDYNWSLGTLVDYLEIYQQILTTNSEASQPLQDLISQYDFLIYAFQPLITSGSVTLDFGNLGHKESVVIPKLKKFIESTKTIELPKTGNADLDIFLDFIQTQVQHFVSQIELRPQLHKIKLYTKNLSINTARPNLNLQNYLQELVDYLDSVQTNLSLENTEILAKILGISFDSKLLCETQDYEFETSNNLDGADFLQSKIDQAKASQKPILILCGLNSSINTIEKLCLNNGLMKDVLLIGESGGITKIMSKIDQGFVGVVAVKFSALDFLLKASKSDQFASIVIFDRPYFEIHHHWYKQAKSSANSDQYLLQIKNLYLRGKVNLIHNKFGCPVEFVFNLV